MTTVRLMIGAVFFLAVSACSSAEEREAADTADASAALSQQRNDEPELAGGLAAAASPGARARMAELPAQSDGDADADGDLVADTDDQCQDSTPGAAVDTDGCPVFSGAIRNLEFAPDDDALNSQARQALDALIADLNAHPDVVIAVNGHTDNRGLASNNLDLSKRRVIAVVRYLVEQGVPAARLKPYGYGESRPVKSNATAEGRRSNRRIEVSQVRA